MQTKQTFLVYGEPASKANSRRIVLIKGLYRSIKSEKALNYTKSFQKQTQVQLAGKRDVWSEDVKVTITIWYASRRPDLDESVILDCLQGVAYENDRQVKEKHIYWGGVDRDNPRCEITVEKIMPPA
jgi:Holliday junction resolvase RusA-like endonuclease